MKKLFLLILAATAIVASPVTAAEKPAKVPKIKLETLKPGKVKLDPRLGYILVRLGPSTAETKLAGVGFNRINAATGKAFEAGEEDVPQFDRTLAVVTNIGRSFGDVDGHGVYLMSAYPGRWVISNVDSTCLSLGSYGFEVKQGEITDIGVLLTAAENGESSVPELANAKLSQDLIDHGTMTNIVMSNALFAKPGGDTPTLPAELASFPVTKSVLSEEYRSENRCRGIVNRAASLPPLGHQPPLTQAEARAAIDKLNPPERVEAARKRAERRAAEAAATRK